jgi:hypothetical protein
MPTGRKLPAVTKNKNYPQPVKHLKPMALRQPWAWPEWVLTPCAQFGHARLPIRAVAEDIQESEAVRSPPTMQPVARMLDLLRVDELFSIPAGQ